MTSMTRFNQQAAKWRRCRAIGIALIAAAGVLLIDTSGRAEQVSPVAEQQQDKPSPPPAQGTSVGLRDPNAYADGYDYSDMPGREQADRMVIGKIVGDQIESASGRDGTGVAWDLYGSYGRDQQKLWVRSEGGVLDGHADYNTSAEGLWWRAFSPFWATVVGIRQDFGPGAHTHAAVGVEGLAPYWFDLAATAYVGSDGGVSARLKGSYDVLFTNRLILSPEIESNLYSKANPERLLGTGFGNIELQLRLRYEITRKLAPYVGIKWDRALGSTADRLQVAGKRLSDATVVAGLRIWR